ncbi:hypothetical protein V8E54_012823 [Elaphomyces granulatus]
MGTFIPEARTIFLNKVNYTYYNFMNNVDPIENLVRLLEYFLRQRGTRSHIYGTNESTFQITIELLWFKLTKHPITPELSLIVDPKNWSSGFADIFIRHDNDEKVVIMELKDVSLRNLWRATVRDPEVEPAGQSDYKELIEALQTETEDQLLNRSYSFYDTKEKKYVKQQVRQTLDDATQQLTK